MKYKTGEEFLNKLYQNMYLEEVVMHTASISDTPTERIEKYLKRLEDVHEKAKNNSHNMDLLKSFYYKKYVIKELSENYIEMQRRILREQGYGNIGISKTQKAMFLDLVQRDQKKSLDNWIEYFCSDDAMYPMWFKNYAFQGMLKLGKFEKERREFGKRTITTAEPFLELNREVLAQVYDSLSHEIGQNNLTVEEEKALNNGESFKKLYTYYLRKANFKMALEETDGIWIKYNQGDDYQKLWESLQGKNTGWCTVGKNTCKLQLKFGDFYVYYTKDESGEYTNPRVAIRMDGKSEIAEVRGIAKDQNIEDTMLDITSKKLDEFPDKRDYQKKVQDMKMLTVIDEKTKQNQELTKEELIFLYEIKSKIRGFGYSTDPRLEEIKSKRDIRRDCARIFDCREDQVATSILDFEKNDIVVYIGNLDWHGTTIPPSFKNLRAIIGHASFDIASAHGLENLQFISGYANFSYLKSAKGLEKLESIGEDALFGSLTSAKGLENLKSIGRDADFYRLISAKGLEKLELIGRDARFSSLISSIGLEKLEAIGGTAQFDKMLSAEGLSNLKTISGIGIFGNLINAKGLEELLSIGGDAYFDKLLNAESLKKLKIIGGCAHFSSLKNSRGLENLHLIGENACFGELLDAKGLKNLDFIGGCAEFGSLTDSVGLENLYSIGGSAEFIKLLSARGLTSLQSIGIHAYFLSLVSGEGLENLAFVGEKWFSPIPRPHFELNDDKTDEKTR